MIVGRPCGHRCGSAVLGELLDDGFHLSLAQGVAGASCGVAGDGGGDSLLW